MNTPNPPSEKPAPPSDFRSLHTLAIVGMGLLGGSVAGAARQVYPGIKIIGCARRSVTRRFALDAGLTDEATEDPCVAAAAADLVVIATPVDRIAETVAELAERCPKPLFTDVGSTKKKIVDAVMASPAAPRFVAAHPIAGSEKTGIENSRADLFRGKPVVITPSGVELPNAVDTVSEFWMKLGGEVISMDAERHDRLLAITSHMPHLMSALIADAIPDEAMPLVGSGWLDTTRIAAGDASLWTAIVNENRDAILHSLRSVETSLGHLVDVIERGDDSALQTMLESARRKRSASAR